MQVALKWLLEEEKRLNVLYSILSKELLLFILESYLPVLTEIINTYLAQVVDYEISIKLKENTDKLELETKVLDSKGEREIKSLSWWQKTILKLVWMLAISSYMDTDMLFLDETVNNLDAWTVSRVAEMLDDFVKKKNIWRIRSIWWSYRKRTKAAKAYKGIQKFFFRVRTLQLSLYS